MSRLGLGPATEKATLRRFSFVGLLAAATLVSYGCMPDTPNGESSTVLSGTAEWPSSFAREEYAWWHLSAWNIAAPAPLAARQGTSLWTMPTWFWTRGHRPGTPWFPFPAFQHRSVPARRLAGMVVNAIKASCAGLLVAADAMPPVLTASCLAGEDRSHQLFEAAYDEHARRLARLFEGLGQES